ncbi:MULTISPECIES: hypothetical protein [unclassified Bradyrhizobium]|uniref:hypothetical protein n=1 Tax=unclassified Bradyrhizobium TaxID=2631580 RepID=UPI002915F37B|nr:MULTISPECIES: hypothetical protein [unclassified Bradyrhizobium]
MNRTTKTIIITTVAGTLIFGPAIHPVFPDSIELSVSAASSVSANSSASISTVNTITDEQIEIVQPVRDQQTS